MNKNKLEKLSKDKLLNRLQQWKEKTQKRIQFIWWDIDEQAHQQIKKCINEAHAIPNTSEREAELEEVIIKMQAEIDRYKPKAIDERFVEKKYIEFAKKHDYPLGSDNLHISTIAIQFGGYLLSQVKKKKNE